MRNYFFLILLSIPLIGIGQRVYNDGASVYVTSGTSAYMIGMGFTNQTNGTHGGVDNDGDIYVEGNWNNNATGGNFLINTNDTGTVHLIGSSPRSLGGNRPTHFENLNIDHTSSGITMNEPSNVLFSLSLTNGILFSDSINHLIIEDNATATAGSTTSYVDGPLTKIGNDNFVFPVGDGDVWARIGIDNSISSNLTDEYSAQYIDNSYTVAAVDSTLHNASTIEHWRLSRASGSDTIPITLFWESSTRSVINSVGPDLVVAGFNGSKWTNLGNTDVSGAGSGYLVSASIPDFSTTLFTFGSLSSGVNVLPIKLISFSAIPVENTVQLNWSTALEIDNDYFVVERSKDAIFFEDLAYVSAVGNSTSEQHYSFIDDQPHIGHSYYRLTQTDVDGQSETFSMVSILFNNIEETRMYPNPITNNMLYIKMKGKAHYGMEFNLYSPSGNLVHSASLSPSNDSQTIKMQVPDLPRGLYVAELIGLEENYREILRID